MHSGMAETLWRRVKRIHEQDQIRSEPDGELLRRFAAGRDESAFEELLRRYGPLVWGVCVRLLRRTPEAEDAFQAVFLILVRKAAQIRRQAQIAGWLHGTAQKVVRRARKQRLCRHARERSPEPFDEPGHTPAAPRDWLPLLDGALQKLPEKYREVLILCELQERPRAEAARLLSLNENTLSSRLARAKEMLRTKLAPTGVSLPAGLAVAVPAALQSAALQLSVRLIAHAGPLSRVLPAALLPLVHGGSKLVFISKSLTCLAAGVLVTLGLIRSEAVPQGNPEAPPPVKQPAPRNDPEPAPAASAKAVPVSVPLPGNTDLARMQGKWRAKSVSRRNVPGDKNAPNNKQLKDVSKLTLYSGAEVSDIWFRGKEVRVLFSGAIGFVGTINLKENFDPRRIDLELPDNESPENAWMSYGVYSFSPNGELTLLLGPDRLNRPTFEEASSSSAAVEIVLERPKDSAANLPEDVRELLGEWTVTSTVSGGKSTVDVSTIEFEADQFLMEVKIPDSKVAGRPRMCQALGYKLNGSRNPRWITLQAPKGAPDSYSGRGIYSISGDTLTIAFSESADRPSELESPEGSNVLVITAKRGPRPSPPQPVPTAAVTVPPDAARPVPTVRAEPDVIEVNHGKIRIPFEVSDLREAEVRDVILWLSRDQGKSFEKAGERPFPGANDFTFITPSSGEFHFAIQTVNQQGVAHPPQEKLQSQVKVRFVLPDPSPRATPALRLDVAPPAIPKPAPTEPDRLHEENQDLRRKLDELMKRVETLEKSAKAKK